MNNGSTVFSILVQYILLTHRGRTTLFPFLVAGSILFLPAIAPAGSDQLFPPLQQVIPDRVVTQKGTLPPWRDLWNQGRDLVRNQKLTEAAEIYARLIDQQNELHQARWELGVILIHLQQWDKAALQLERVLETEPLRADFLTSLGAVLIAQTNYDRAMDLFSRVLEYYPDNDAGLSGKAAVLLATGRRQEALTVLESLFQKQPDNIRLREKIARLAFDLGLYERSRPHLAAISLNADNDPELLEMNAILHEKIGLENIAAGYWEKLLKQNPDHLAALQRLASLKEKAGDPVATLQYLHRITELKPDIAPHLKIARLHIALRQPEKALEHLALHLKKFPKDQQAVAMLIKTEATLGNKEGTLAALEHYFAIADQPDPQNIRQAAELYAASGRFHKAIPLYRHLLTLTPDDPAILATLANDLLLIGSNEGALKMWERLAEVTPTPLNVYWDMANLLKRLGRKRELLGVLQKIHALAPHNQEANLQLAQLFLQDNQLAESRVHFNELERSGSQGAPFYYGRAILNHKSGLLDHAAEDYRQFLNLQPDDDTARLQYIQLAGELGFLDIVRSELARLKASENFVESPQTNLLISGILRKNGDFAGSRKAIRQALAAGFPPDTMKKVQTDALLADAAWQADAFLPFEAEQSLRRAYLITPDSLRVPEALFTHHRQQNNLDNAAIWLQIVKDKALEQPAGSGPDSPPVILSMQLLIAHEDYDEALETGRRALAGLNDDKAAMSSAGIRDLRLLMAKTEMILEDYPEVETILNELAQNNPDDLEPLVLLQQSAQLQGNPQDAAIIAAKAARIAAKDLAFLLTLIELYERYRLVSSLHDMAARAYQQAPDSTRAAYYLYRAKELTGAHAEAAELLQKMADRWPANERFLTLLAHRHFSNGNYSDSLAYCNALLDEQPGRPDLLQLKARILWVQDKKSEALNLYEQYLTPTVTSCLLEAGIKLSITADGDKSYLTRIEELFTDSIAIPDTVDQLMATSTFAASGRQNQEVAAAVDFFSQYQWQVKLQREYLARRAVSRGEYYQAGKIYSSLLAENPRDEAILFDLAGIYSSQGSLGKEAALYNQLNEYNPSYPGLKEAVTRNRLKRRPRLSMDYGYEIDEGWNGLKAIKKEWGEALVWYSPKLQHESSLALRHTAYRSTEGHSRLTGTKAVASYGVNYSSTLTMTAAGGLENIAEADNTIFLFDITASNAFGDNFTGMITMNRDLIRDTVASLTATITKNELAGTLTMDIVPGLSAGANYTLAEYSDNNMTKGYTLWASAVLLQEPAFLTLNYSFDFKDSLREHQEAIASTGDKNVADYPYWTPKDYWHNEFSIFFKHRLSSDTLDRGSPSYYTARYAAGYDSDGRGSQSIAGEFTYELSTELLLRAKAENYSSPQYRHKLILMGITYRW